MTSTNGHRAGANPIKFCFDDDFIGTPANVCYPVITSAAEGSYISKNGTKPFKQKKKPTAKGKPVVR
jgi:hypothetical protein